MNMNLDLKSVIKQLGAVADFLLRYLKIIVAVCILGLYSFLVIRINNLAAAVPSDDAVTEKLAEIKAPKVDPKAIEALNKLESRSVEVRTLFKNARDNPFQN